MGSSGSRWVANRRIEPDPRHRRVPQLGLQGHSRLARSMTARPTRLRARRAIERLRHLPRGCNGGEPLGLAAASGQGRESLGMTAIGYALSSEEHEPGDLVEHAVPRGAARLRVRADLRPLPPVDRPPGPEPVRLERPRRDRQRDGATRHRHRRDVPDDADPSGDHRPGRRHDRGPDARAVLPRRRDRRAPQRAHPRATPGPSGRRAPRCSRRPSRSSAQLWTGEMTSHHGRYYTVENARIYTLPDVAAADPRRRQRPRHGRDRRADRRRVHRHRPGEGRRRRVPQRQAATARASAR